MGTEGKKPTAAWPCFAGPGCLLGQKAVLGLKIMGLNWAYGWALPWAKMDLRPIHKNDTNKTRMKTRVRKIRIKYDKNKIRNDHDKSKQV